MTDQALTMGTRPPSRSRVLTVGIASVVAGVQLGSLLGHGLGEEPLADLMVLGLATLVAVLGLLAGRRSDRGDIHPAHGALALDAALDCIITIDGRGTVCGWNRAATETFGYSEADAVGQELAGLIVPPADRKRHRLGVAECTREDRRGFLDRRVQVSALHARGGHFPVELTVTRSQETPPMFTAFVRDITEQRRREVENEQLAAIVRSSEVAILAKDVDGVVTAWNRGAENLYGYSAREAVGRHLVDLIVPPDRMAEVGALTKEVLDGGSFSTTTQRQTKSGEVLDVSLRAFPVRDLERKIIGVSVSAHDITERRRREEHDARDAERRLWCRRIEEALAHDRLVFWGQPVVDARSGQIDHHELLVRMQLGDRVVLPYEFLPHAESCDLITEIDRWAITRGAELGHLSKVAINLSAKGLATPGLIDFVREALVKASTPPSNVLFEITETAAVENLDASHALVEQLRKLGCRAALDDFGTGYGSFTYLKALPVTELKIDMSFVRGLLEDEVDFRVVKSIIGVAETFEMNTVAEGVEDEAALDLLVEMGVSHVQGYHLGRPRPLTSEFDVEGAPLPSVAASNGARPRREIG